MEYEIEVKSKCMYRWNQGDTTSQMLSSKLHLVIAPPLDASKYFMSPGMPSKDGSMMITANLVAAISGNIHYAHQNGFRDSAEHLLWVITELEKLFVEQHNIKRGTYP